jgi:hypothetical protein
MSKRPGLKSQYVSYTNCCIRVQQSLTPPPPPPPPPPPTNLLALMITTTSFQISFEQTGEVTNYKYSLNNGSTFTLLNPPSIVSPITITGLLQNTTYQVVLQAINANGNSENSNTLTVTTNQEQVNGSIYFDNSYLVQSSSAENSMIVTGDFTFEFWVKIDTQQQPYPALFSNSLNSIDNLGFEINIDRLDNPGKISGLFGNSEAFFMFGTLNISILTWHHIAFTRNGTTLSFFVNGTNDSTITFNNPIYFNNLAIGSTTYRQFGGPSITDVNGYISNIRLVVGTSLYNSNFTPPTEPLSLITGTELLMNTPNNANYITDSSPNNITFAFGKGTVISSSDNPFV